MKTASVENNGFEGILYPGNGRKEKVMIVMSGSNGGMVLTRQEAYFYHMHGVPSLALALFGTKETPKELSLVPVEYAENAILWLKKEGYQKIGIDGTSKGSEMALLAASLFPEISCVIARVPSYFVSEGLSGKGKSKGPSGTSCWSYQGREIPYAPYRKRSFDLLKTIWKEKELALIFFNKEKDVTEESLIPIENIQAPILFLSSKNDRVWPSYESACRMDAKLTESGFAYQHKHITYEHMSHALLTELPWMYKLAFQAERNYPSECEEDRMKLRRDLLAWIDRGWQ